MILAQWRFTGLEFEMLWTIAGRDRLPFPLQFRPVADHIDELNVQRRDAAKTLLPRVDQTLHRALTCLLDPVARVEVCGFDDVRSKRRVRVHAGARRGFGVVTRQLPGASDDVGADVVVSLCNPQDLAQHVVSALPQVAAGSMRPFAVRDSELRKQSGGSVLRAPGDWSARERIDSFFERPRSCVAEITTFAGPTVDSRPTADGRAFFVMDFEGDGRYLVKTGETIQAAPTDSAEIAAELQRFVDAVSTRRARV